VLNAGLTGNLSAILCGIDWVTATREDDDPSNDIAVANMSLAGKGSDDRNCGMTNNDSLHLAICNSVTSGVTYVVGAGNSGVDFQQFTPAAYDEVLTATAVADSDGRPGGTGTSCQGFGDDLAASFSNFATLPSDQVHTVAAPGTCVLSTWIDRRYILNWGTSFATPHAAGAVALCIASGSCSGLTPPQIIQKIVGDAATYNTATPGYGFVGDPLRPISGKYYGYLIRAGLY
jgi:subtilisin